MPVKAFELSGQLILIETAAGAKQSVALNLIDWPATRRVNGLVEEGNGSSESDKRASARKDPQDDKCQCSALEDQKKAPGLIWIGRTLTLRELAERAAPILWFSPDEPLLRGSNGEKRSLPQRHPCDTAQQVPGAGIAYYQAQRINLRNGDERFLGRPEDDPDFLRKTHSLTLRYYFYYERDTGVGEHNDDLEVAEVKINLDKHQDCYTARVTQVAGLAHGVHWYTNILNVEEGTKFPITILVEEGKHASCPDRNGDGHYTPGFDVNDRVNDAWGLRDVMRSGYLSPSFHASMTKPRDDGDRVFPISGHESCCSSNGNNLNRPPAGPFKISANASAGAKEVQVGAGRGGNLAAGASVVLREGSQRVMINRVATTHDGGDLVRLEQPLDFRLAANDSTITQQRVYELRPANSLSVCEILDSEEHDKLLEMMERHHFGEEHEVKQISVTRRIVSKPLRDPRTLLPSLNFRYDDGYGLSFSFPGISIGGGWLVPKLDYILSSNPLQFLRSFTRDSNAPGVMTTLRAKTWGAEAVYMNSASRWFDWYAGVGWERLEEVYEENNLFDPTIKTEQKDVLATEAGFKFRFRTPLSFLGVKLGLRTSGFSRLARTRFIFEFGAGAW